MIVSEPGSIVKAPTTLHRAVLNTVKGSAGNLVEWYDVYTYTVFVPYFEAQFFGAQDTRTTLYAYAVFAITFLMRPVGSWFFGRYADRHGRRAAMVLSVSIMAAASFLIAIMPTYATIGVWAAIGLMLCRLIQGFATGGEYGTSATYMSEAAIRNRRGFLSSFQYVTLVGGQVVAQLVLLIMTATMSEPAIKSWGWRVAFGIGGLAALVVMWIRRSMDESLTTEHLIDIKEGRDRRSGTLTELFVHYWRSLLLVFLITLGGTVAFYTYSVNAPSIVKATVHPAFTATLVNLIGLIILVALQPIGGLISDRVGRKPLLIWSAAGGMAYTWILFSTLPSVRNPWLALLLCVIGYVFLTGYTSINAVVKAEQFPAHIRALGVGLGYALANSIFGGTAPLVYQAAKASNAVPAFIGYVTACLTVSLVVYIFFLRNRDETYLDREQGHAFVPFDTELDLPLGTEVIPPEATQAAPKRG